MLHARVSCCAPLCALPRALSPFPRAKLTSFQFSRSILSLIALLSCTKIFHILATIAITLKISIQQIKCRFRGIGVVSFARGVFTNIVTTQAAAFHSRSLCPDPIFEHVQSTHFVFCMQICQIFDGKSKNRGLPVLVAILGITVSGDENFTLKVTRAQHCFFFSTIVKNLWKSLPHLLSNSN